MDTQRGVSCAVFRNEGRLRSSDLILAAMEIAWRKWGLVRLYTYVDPRRVRSSNPGYSFQAAGWRRVGVTRDRGLVVLAHDPFRRSFPSEAVREVPAGDAGAGPGLRPE